MVISYGGHKFGGDILTLMVLGMKKVEKLIHAHENITTGRVV